MTVPQLLSKRRGKNMVSFLAAVLKIRMKKVFLFKLDDDLQLSVDGGSSSSSSSGGGQSSASQASAASITPQRLQQQQQQPPLQVRLQVRIYFVFENHFYGKT